MALKGGPELKARLKAAGQMFKPYGRTWADATADEAKRMVPVDTGRLRQSLRRRNATARRATVVGAYWANFVDAGSKAHEIKARRKPRLIFETGGQTIFAKRVHKARIAARPFKRRAAMEALRKHPMKQELIEQWNRAA